MRNLYLVAFSAIFAYFLFRAAMRIVRSQPERRRRTMFIEGLKGVGLYLLLMLGLVLAEPYLLFHPIKYADGWEPPPRSRTVEDVWLDVPEAGRVHAWWCPVAPNKEKWIVLFCHGNGGNLSFYRDIFRWQDHVGSSVLIFDYPGYGQSAGAPTEANCLASGESALQWLRLEKKVPANRLVLAGLSYGGSVATQLAAKHEHHALVLMSAFTSMPDMAQAMFPLFPARYLVRTCCDNLTHIRDYHGRLFIAHGEDDELVPFDHGRQLWEAAPTVRKQLCPMPGVGHNYSLADTVLKEIRTFLSKD